MKVLNLENVNKSYMGFHLDNISMQIESGTIMGLVGPNGSGKTTTIKLILDIQNRESGNIEVLGLDNVKDSVQIKQDIGVVFDTNYFVDEWKISDVEKAVGGFYHQWNRKRFYQLLDSFHITKEKKVMELSKGMQMKLMLCCALSRNAKLLILDEPTSGLDPVSRDELMDILRQYVEDGEHSVLFSTHITSDLEKVADSITFINYGKLVYTGNCRAFIDAYVIVSGEVLELTDDRRAVIKGMRDLGNNYEALIPSAEAWRFDGCGIRSCNIEDIVVLSSRKGRLQ